LTYRFSALPWRPSLTGAFAFASGDDGLGRDGRFRQTGLQKNIGTFDGIAEFPYYGAALDPELSNLAVLTLGAGVRPWPSASVDLVYHYYRQHTASSDWPETALDAEPDGRARELGHGIDLVLGWEPSEGLLFELVSGVFLPGTAYGGAGENAYFVGLEVEFSF
jgi:alginate production protein